MDRGRRCAVRARMSHRLVTWCAWLGLVLIAGPGGARAEDDRAALFAGAGRARPTIAPRSSSIDAQDYVDGVASRRLVSPRGSSGRARGEVGVAGGLALGGDGLAG